jgi:multimeric flavodoxin WrbA
MKALILNASPRAAGATALALGLLERRLSEAYQVRRIDLGAKPIAPCLGCLACRPDGRCVLARDGATEAGDAIAEADLIVLASPCYWGNVPSTLKAVLDRNVTTFETFRSGPPEPILTGKKAILIAVTGSSFPHSRARTQAGGTLRALGIPCKAGGISVISRLVVDSGWRYLSGEGEAASVKLHDRLAKRVRALRIN